RDIAASILNLLRNNFANRNVNENFQQIKDLKEFGNDPFKTTRDHLDSWWDKAGSVFWKQGELQKFADSVIESSTQFVLDKAKSNTDYHDSFTRDLLEKMDEYLQQSYKHHKTNAKFEFDLKLHICGIASREFLKMHRKYLSDKDPKIQLEKKKDFLDLYKQRDDCQRKANDFIRCCIKPAVEEYINRSLGIDIVDEIVTGSHSAEYSSRSFFQYNIQEELLQNDDFDSFV
ncbi:up-regulator of cell proliferation-like isoform X3, partial [Scomber scombrus]